MTELNAAASVQHDDEGVVRCRLPLLCREPGWLAASCLSPSTPPPGSPAPLFVSMLDDLDSLPPLETQGPGDQECTLGDGMLPPVTGLASSHSLEGLDSLPPLEEPSEIGSTDLWPDLRNRFLQRLDMNDRAAMSAGVRRICTACDSGVMHLGTGCSGTDCPVLVTRDLFEVAGRWPICVSSSASSCSKPQVRHVFSCEKDCKKGCGRTRSIQLAQCLRTLAIWSRTRP